MAIGNRFVVLIHGAVADAFARDERSYSEVLNLMAGGEQMEALEARLTASDAVAGNARIS
jgi:hypothetical protein